MYTRNHVIGDLEPFICVFPQCQRGGHRGGTGPLTFETSKAWFNHMQAAHGHAWECRAPSHDPIVFEQEMHYQEHSVTEHGVPEAHVGTLSRAARRPVLDKVLNCPFGDDFQPPDKVESSTVFLSEALQSHVAGHMKEIALLALQKLPSDDDDENAENVDSDQPLEDDGPAGVVGVARQSMYSVLEDEDLDFQDDDTGDADDNPERHEEEISARVLNRLLEFGANPNADPAGSKGRTALQAAAGNGHIEVVNQLLAAGGAPSDKAIEVASQNNHRDVAERLRKAMEERCRSVGTH